MGYVPSPLTAHELLTIARSPELCAKTIFDISGGGVPLSPPPTPDLEAKAIICSSGSIEDTER